MLLFFADIAAPNVSIEPGGVVWPTGWPLPATGQNVWLGNVRWVVRRVDFHPVPVYAGAEGYGDPAPEVWVLVVRGLVD